MGSRAASLLLVLLLAAGSAGAASGDMAAADLRISGSSLTIVTTHVETGIDIPTTVQTEFGGKRNDLAPFVPGLLAVAELSGPGLDVPITLETTPGHPFRIPGLRVAGDYALQNIRLVKEGKFLQPAIPTAAAITVSDVLKTRVKVTQLTAQQLRERGINTNGSNYDYYEYTVSIEIAPGEIVTVPYVVAIDPRTHQARPVVEETPYSLPPDRKAAPPRWAPPTVAAFEFVSEAEMPFLPQSPLDPAPARARPSIPAALVMPNDIAVLHQFFEIGLVVSNGASPGSSIELDSIDATIHIPSTLRVAATRPVVGFGQAVPILDADGMTILRAQAEGKADWVLEALRAGGFTIEFDLRATYRVPGQPEVPLRASPKASILVHDPRFNITFSHPDVVREGIEYSTFSFVTNMSAALQTIRVASGVKPCAQGFTANICLVEGSPQFHDLTLPPGDTKIVEYQFRPAITGHAYASAGSVEGDALAAAVQLHMGVDANGIPLSPATLLLPHYARYLDPTLVDAQLELLGLGYSLASAPLNQSTATFPRVIRADVFERATDLARAGQRVFVGESEELALFAMNLALLGNESELREWDDLRRLVESGRSAQAAIAKRLEQAAIGNAAGYAGLADRIAPANAHRAPFLAAMLHAPAGAVRPFAVSLRGATTGRATGFDAQAAGQRAADLPFADVTDLDPRDRGAAGALALVGRWTEDVTLIVTPAVSGPVTIELIHPAKSPGRILRTALSLTGAAGEPVSIAIVPGQTQVEARNAAGAILAVAAPSEKIAPPLAPVAARQDLHLDEDGHRVSVLFNRPIGEVDDLARAFSAKVVFNGDGISVDRARPISGAALQADGRIVNLNFDHILSANASYPITIGSVDDPLTGAPASIGATVLAKVENVRQAGILFGKVLRADNVPVADAEVALSVYSDRSLPRADSVQYDLTPSDGTFFFEYVPRDPAQGYDGAWRLDAVDDDGKATSTSAAIRTPGAVQYVNLVYLGRGSAEGYVRYEDGTKAAGAAVVVGSTMFNESRRATADAGGFYRVENLPVGPLTFSATDSRGRIVYATNDVRTAGTVVVQNLVIPLGEAPGAGVVRGLVIRSDSRDPVAGARVGVFSRGYAVGETYTATDGRFEFGAVPSGFVTLLAAEWSVSRIAAAQDFDLRPDSTRELTMILEVRPAEALARVDGFVESKDPLNPAVARRVPGAIVQIAGLGAATAAADGTFAFEGVPSSFAGGNIKAWDPATGRAGSTTLPSPLTSSSSVAISIPAEGGGKGTIRVKLADARGFPLDGFRVFVPGYPTRTDLAPKLDGVYELSDVKVGRTETIWAVSADGAQHASGSARVAFDGHVVPLNLRLPGQGRVRVAVRSDIALITDVTIRYMRWNDGEQNLTQTTVTRSTMESGGAAGYAIFDGVPALSQFTVSSSHPVHGKASASGRLAFDGELRTLTLQLSRLAALDGAVYAIDGRTPVAGATVRLVDGRQDQGATITEPDGSFSFENLPAGVAVQAIASISQDGIYRTGYANAKTPAEGGAVEDVGVVLRRQGAIRARVVYAAYKVFDPNDPSKNVPDDTLEDLADNAPVPYARLWLRELGFPSRAFGSASEPRTADAAGRIDFANVFEGSLRASAWDPGNQELRGTWTGALTAEGEEVVALIGIGGAGVGSLEAVVRDPNEANAPVLNAEVLLRRKKGSSWVEFDFASSDGAGKSLFEQLPPGEYSAQAYSRSQGRSGTSAIATVVANERTELPVLLQFRGEVRGTVVDRFKADPQARIEVSGSHVTLDAFDYVTRTTTNPSGEFVFEGVREGHLELTARDPESNRRGRATRNFSAADGEVLNGILLELEPTETLHAAVYLPADDGSDSGVLAPAINVDVKQRCTTRNWIEFCDFYTSLQQNPITVARMLRDGRYHLAIREIGGEQRTISTSREFPAGSSSALLRLVLPAFGAVRVQVQQAAQPAGGARVTASGGGREATAFTDAAGFATLSGLRLGSVSIQVRSFDGAFTGATSATITSQSTPAIAMVTLGSYAGLAGFVEAEAGGPSVGTIVAARFSGGSVNTLTNGEGRFQIHGVPTSASGLSVAVDYMGPDGVTVGATQSTVARNEHAGSTIELPAVRLDATPPRLLSITPSDGANQVPPDTFVQFVFSEPIPAAYETSNHFALYSTGSGSAVQATFDRGLQADGTYFMRLKPSVKLASNTLYRVVVSSGVADASGHALGVARGSSFITTDYAEPRIVRTEPAANQPLLAATTFRFVFNEAMNPAPWAPGGSGSIRLFKVSGPGGAVVAEKSGRAFLDLASPDTLVFGPDDPIERESYYRATVAGASDLQGNVAAAQSFEWASFDATKPFVVLVSPLPPGDPLVSGTEYTLVPDIRNGAADGSPAADVEQVEFFRVDGETETYLTKKVASPYAYRFVAPDAAAEGTTIAFRAIARDRSLNSSAPATIVLPVRRNEAPKNVAVTLDRAEAYPSNRITTGVSFEDEGLLATVAVTAGGTQTGGAAWEQIKTKQVNRSSVTEAWPPISLAFDLPPTLAAGSTVTFTARVTDVRGLASSASTTASVLADAAAPEILAFTPTGETRFAKNQAFRVEVQARDLESGVADVVAKVGRADAIPLAFVSNGSAPGVKLYRSAEVVLPVSSVDTRISIVVTVKDWGTNAATRTVEVIAVGEYDPEAPKVAWATPVDRAAYPAGASITIPLRVVATDRLGIAGVELEIAGASPLAATRVGTTDVWEKTLGVTMPAPGESLELTAIVRDSDAHEVRLPIRLDAVAIDRVVELADQAITAANVAEWSGTSVLVRGAAGRIVAHVPLSFSNLILIDGAKLDTKATTTGVERKLEVEVAGTLYVDGASSIDLTGTGYQGGWGVDTDGSNTKNEDARGRTAGNVAAGGAEAGTSASHGGLGGLGGGTTTNQAYGSITAPAALGSGGGGNASCCTAGAPGGGAASIRGRSGANDLARIAVAGAIRADGGSGVGKAGAGSGGSILIDAKQVILGALARVSANGGDDDARSNGSAGGGGGRVAIRASVRFDASAELGELEARGGRNGAPDAASSRLDGGAGTIFLARPGAADGMLIVSSVDPDHTEAAHQTRPTLLAGAGLRFDAVTVGPRALLRIDDSIVVAGVADDLKQFSIDPSAVVLARDEVPRVQLTTIPVAGGSIPRGGSLSAQYTAASPAGIGAVISIWSPATPDRRDVTAAYPPSVAPAPYALPVPADAPLGAATLKLRAEDRAGRVAETSSVSYTIVENTPVELTRFDVTPAALVLYPGGSASVMVEARDDVQVKTLTFVATLAGAEVKRETRTVNAAAVAAVVFSYAIPAATSGGQDLVLKVLADDGFPGRAPSERTATVAILADAVGPAVTIVAPAPNAPFKEGTGNKMPVSITAVDAEVGVASVTASVEGGETVALTKKSGNVWEGLLAVPPVSGTASVPRAITVRALDYAGNPGSASVTVRIEPLDDSNAPLVTWACPTAGGIFPAGAAVRFRVYALGNRVENAGNGVQKVEFFVGASETPIAGEAVVGSANYYQSVQPFVIPADAAVGAEFTVRAVVTNVAGLTMDPAPETTFTVIGGIAVESDLTIDDANAATYAGLTLIVKAGTTTIVGPRSFARLVVLDGAKVTHPATDASTVRNLAVVADRTYVACGGSIDVSGRGFPGSASVTGATWPGAVPSTEGGGGGHGGLGGKPSSGTSGEPYGSVMWPSEPGGAGADVTGVAGSATAGGGAVRIDADRVQIDGSIFARGAGGNSGGAGAGGSVLIESREITGSGQIGADGGASSSKAAGGGGRIALHYATLTLDRARLSAAGGSDGTASERGSAGTIYLRANDAEGAKSEDVLIVDNADVHSPLFTPMVAAGSGTVTTIAGANLTLSSAVPAWIEGAEIDLIDATGDRLASYPIAARNSANEIRVELPPGQAAVGQVPPVPYRIVWRFDSVLAANRGQVEFEQLDTALVDGAETEVIRVEELRSHDVVLAGVIEAERVTAGTLWIAAGGLLAHPVTTATEIHRLAIEASVLTVDAGGWIDVSGRGFPGSTAATGATWPSAVPSREGGGGGHGGVGGRPSSGTSGEPYGSVMWPWEPGGAGADVAGVVAPGSSGGGAVRIDADRVQIDGGIRARGAGGSSGGAGAGGSVLIESREIAGLGEIRADGGVSSGQAAGGGGRIALHYTTLTLDRARLSAAGGTDGTASERGSAGTIYLRANDATGAKSEDALIIDNAGVDSPHFTPMVAGGAGTVTAIAGANLTLSSAVPEWIEGAEIDLIDATGVRLASYAIVARVSANELRVALPAGQTAVGPVPPVPYRIVWRFDSVLAANRGRIEIEQLDTALVDGAGTEVIRVEELRSDDLTIAGVIEAERLIAGKLRIAAGGLLTHPVTTATELHRLTIEADALAVDVGGSIDVSDRGFPGSTSATGATWPGAVPSTEGGGGGHGGGGGRGSGTSGQPYGSVLWPSEPGGAGADVAGIVAPGSSGGGAVRIDAHRVQIDGSILARGAGGSSGGAGAGGSVLIESPEISGSGVIAADGGASSSRAAGGGGRIALHYTTLTLDRARLSAGGGSDGTASERGSAGTIYLRANDAAGAKVLDELIVSNGTIVGAGKTSLPGVGYRTATSVAVNGVEDAAGAMLGPDHLRGVRLVINHEPASSWPILSNQATAVTVDVSSNPLTAAVGDSFRGLYRFDKLTLRNAKLETIDLLQYGVLDSDASSTITGNNQRPPVIDPARVSIVSGTVGASVVGAAGAAADPDLPLTAIARNERTGTEVSAAVAVDGSFMIAVGGNAGDVITVRARDANVFPLESRPIVAGTLSTATPDPTRLEYSTWGVDAAFRARTIARDGSTLAVASYDADGAGSSSRLVLFDLANPAAPARRATIAGTGEILDVAVAGGFAFTAAGRFWSADLAATAPAPLYAADACGSEHAVVLAGGYAFASEGDCDSNNYIDVYDVSTPSAPRYVTKKAITAYTPYAYTDLFALGTDWLVAISSVPIGSDLVMVDRRDPNDLKKGKELAVPNFDAFRGALNGSVLWVVSRTSSEVATFDLSNPADPKLIARAYAGATPNGITIAGGYAIVASGGSGLFAFDASDPTLMTRAGTLTVAGTAWDVAAFGGYLYVADDTGLSIVPINIGPVVDTSRIQVDVASSGTATVRGLPLAVTGGVSPTVEVPGVAPAPVAADGSFVLAVSAQSGQSLRLTVRNGDGRSTSHPLRVPFAASVEVLPAAPAQAANDANYRARRLAVAGTQVIATTGTNVGTSVSLSDKALLFTLPNASATASVLSVATAAGGLYDVEILDGRAFAAGNLLASWALSSLPPAVSLGDTDLSGTELAIAVVPGFAFTANSDFGRVLTWDISNPAAPRYLATSNPIESDREFCALIAVDPGLLVAISSNTGGGVNWDVSIIDRSNPSALTRLGRLDVPNFVAVDGAVIGATLYLAGLDAGVAIVDISTPSAPKHLATIDTPGIARAVALSGPGEIVVADGGGPGITFIDVADRTRPFILGSQPLVGNATDVRVIGDEIVVATDHHVQIVRRP